MGTEVEPNRVSVIVPCYNVAPYIERFFRSLIEQTYKQLDIILVEDGSTDLTSELIDRYVPYLKAEGYRVMVIRQQNRGLAGAVDSGLRHVTGEFLTWPDPDDWLTPDSIAGRVGLLRQHPDAALLRSNAEIFVDSEQEIRGSFRELGEWVRPADGLFEKLLFLSTYFAPVCHMVRAECFFEVYPEKEIYVTPRASQNLQMLLPLVERYPAIETAKSFAVWRKRSDSRSQRAKAPGDLIPRLEMLHDVSRHVTARLIRSPGLAEDWSHQNFYRNKLLPVAFEGRMKDKALEYLQQAKLSWADAWIARGMIHVWCRRGVVGTGDQSRRVAALFSRVFNRVVRFRREDKVYPTGNEAT